MKLQLTKIFLSFFIIFILSSVIPFDNAVKGSSVGFSYGLENTPLLSQVSVSDSGNGFLSTSKLTGNYFCVGDAVLGAPFSGSRMFFIKATPGNDVSGFMNFTYSGGYLTDFSIWVYSGTSGDFYLSFNDTNGINIIKFHVTDKWVKYRDYIGGYNYLYYTTTTNWYNFGFTIIDNETIDYYSKKSGNTSFTVTTGVPANFMPENGSQIKSCYCHLDSGGLTWAYKFDLVNVTISSSIGTGGVSGGCTDFSGYDNINHFFAYTKISSFKERYIEMRGTSEITARITGFELFVGKVQINISSILSNYSLYINNNYVGNPVCFSQYDNLVYSLEWDLTSINISLINEIPVFELFIDLYQGSPPGPKLMWNIAVEQRYGGPQGISGTYGKWYNSHIDGSYDCDNENRFESPNWIMYYSSGDFNKSNPGYTNSISFLDSSGIQLPNGIWGIPRNYIFRTTFIHVAVDTLNKYTLNIFDENGNIPVSAYEQYYPKDVLSYKRDYGFTAYENGNYTICLMDGTTYILNESLNITDLAVSFAIWSSPNPSFESSVISIGSFALNPYKYSKYALVLIPRQEDINNIDGEQNIVIYFDSFIDNFYYAESFTPVNYGTMWIRLFATNGTIYFPITSPYSHYIERMIELIYIRTSLKNNVASVNQKFNVYGVYSSTISSASVFLDNEEILPISSGSFQFEASFDATGTHKYDLKEKQGDNWVTLSSVTVSIGNEETKEEDVTQFVDSIPLLIKIIISIVIVIFITLLPMIISAILTRGNGIPDIPGTLYAIFFFFGLAIVCAIGLLIWAIFFIIFFSMLIYFAIQYIAHKRE